MYRWISADDVTRISTEGISAGEVDRRLQLVTKYTAKEDLLGDAVMPPFYTINPSP